MCRGMVFSLVLGFCSFSQGVYAACLQQPCGLASPSLATPSVDGPYETVIGDSSKLQQWDSRSEPATEYRAWEKRFSLRPEDERAESAFEYGFHEFDKDLPRYPDAPNSADRDAESSVILVFVLTALSTVLGAVFAWEFLQAERHHQSLVLALTLPWALASWWLMRVAIRNFLQPGRQGSGMRTGATYNWQCDSATWYLFLSPGITLLAIASQSLLLFGSTSNAETHAPMGRMLPGTWTGGSKQFHVSGSSSRMAAALVKPAVRNVIIFCEYAITVAGSVLACQLVDAGQRTNCEPDVWWAAVVLAATTASVLTLSTLVALCGKVGAFGDLQGSDVVREEGVEFQGIRESAGMPY